MFSVQPENAVASYSSARQKPERSDQPSGSDHFGALVDSNASAANTDRSASDQPDTSIRRSSRDDRQVQKNGAADHAADARPVRQDNSDQDTQAINGNKQTDASSKDTAEHPDTAKTAASGKTGGKTKAARDAKDSKDAANADQMAATAASTIPVAPATGLAVAAIPSAASISTGEASTSVIADAAAVTTATSAASETTTGTATDTAQSAVPPAAATEQTSAKLSADAATQAAAASEKTIDFKSQPEDGDAAAPANAKATADSSAPLSAAASEVTLPAGVELAAPIATGGPAPVMPNDKTTSSSTLKSAALTKTDVQNEAPQTVSAENGKDAKAARTDRRTGTKDADESDAKTAKDGKGGDGNDTKAASQDKPAPGAHEPRIAAQPLTTDPSLQPGAQQQPTQLQTSNTPATPTAQLNAALAAVNTPVPLNSLAADIALKAAGGNSRFEIRLDPAELGRIDVRLDVDKHGQVTSHLTVERPATLEMLRKDAPQLQQALEDAGLKTGDGGLQFSLRDQSSSGQQSNHQSGRNSQRLIITEDTPVPAQIAGQTYGRALGSRSGVDISI